MLDKSNNLRSLALVGANSEIGNEIVKLLLNETTEKLYIFGRDDSLIYEYQRIGIHVEFIHLDVESLNFHQELTNNLKSLGKIDFAILSIGFLPPEHTDLDPNYVLKSMLVNAIGSSVILSCFANKMIEQKSGKILYISTVASMRPRLKNFTYGASKKAADFFVQGLQSKYKKTNLKIILLRPGYVFTKLSKNFEPAPFAINPDKVAHTAIKGIEKSKNVIYAPSILNILMNLVIRLPRFIFDRLE